MLFTHAESVIKRIEEYDLRKYVKLKETVREMEALQQQAILRSSVQVYLDIARKFGAVSVCGDSSPHRSCDFSCW